MRWIEPTDADYDEQRSLFNTMIDKRPRIIAACASPGDVRDALDRARTDDLTVAVRSGGHSVAGMSSVDDGIVIDVRPMKSISVDAVGRRVKVGGGVTWGELDAATQEHGLAVTGGRVSTTGVSGFTLGGGSGWLERRLGLACDNLVGVDLVTADGREVHADADERPDLLWASKGGGGNFGVVTALELALHPVGPMVLAGLMGWPAERATEVARAYRDWADGAPDELGSAIVLLTGPPEEFVPAHLQGQPVLGMAVLWTGDPGAGAQLVQVMRDLGPAFDLVGEMPYAAFNSMLDDPPGFRQYWSADYHAELTDDALEVYIDAGLKRPSPLTQHLLAAWGGALARIPEDSTPLTKRDALWVSHPFATWESPADDAANIAWVKGFRAAIAPYANGGTYLNFIGDEGQDRIAAAFGQAKLDRLEGIKAEYDPRNVFSGNQNVRPRVPA